MSVISSKSEPGIAAANRFGDTYCGQGAGRHDLPLPPVAAQASDDDYRAIVENLPTLCWIADADGYIT